jgi:predicted nucleotidyltransferase
MFEALLARIARGLEQSQIPYMIIGGQAVLVHGEPRLTKDIDVTLGVDLSQLPDVKTTVQKLGLKQIREASDEFIKHTMVLPAAEETSGIRVDFIFSFTPYERQAIERGKEITIQGQKVVFASAEDTIIHKMFAGRPRDLEDIRGITKYQPNLDRKYVEKWLNQFSKVSGKDLVKEFQALGMTE